MFKKYFVIISVFVLSAIILAGCSASDPNERKGETTEIKPAVEAKTPDTDQAKIDQPKTDLPVKPEPVKTPEAPVKVENPEPEKQFSLNR